MIISALGQGNQLELVHTDKLTNSTVYEGAAKTVGNVHLKTNNINLFCDSALFHERQNWVRAFGRVQINQGDTLNLFSDSLFYDGNTSIGVLQSNVRIRDNLYKLTTDSLKFNANTSTAYYTNHAVIKSNQQNLVLKSIVGSYNSASKTFLFKDSVSLTHPEYNVISDTLEFNALTEKVFIHGPSIITLDTTTVIHCEKGVYNTKTDDISIWKHALINTEKQIIEGDSLFFNQRTSYAEGFRNISIRDTTENLILKSHYFLKENDDIMLVDQAQILKPDSKDTLILQADTILQKTLQKNSIRENIAISNVIIEKGELIGTCDSIYFNETDSIIKMQKAPVIWREQTEIKADSIEITLIDNEIKTLDLYENAFMAISHDSVYFDQLSGKQMHANLDSNAIKSVLITGNAETLYFPNEVTKDSLTGEEIKTIKGINNMISSKIRIGFKDSDIQKISFIDDPDATFTSVKSIKQKDLYLKKFKWEINRKPESLLRK